MGSIPVMKTAVEEEAKLIASLEQIIRSLESSGSLGCGTRKTMASLGYRLISIALSTEIGGPEVGEIEHQLSMIETKIMSYDFEEPSVIWDPEEAYAFLNAVEEAYQLTTVLERGNSSRNYDTLLHRAHDLLQSGMAALEQEFRRLLLHNWQPSEEEQTSFRSSEEENADEGSVLSMGDNPFEEVEQRDSSCDESVDYAVELVPQEVTLFLKSIVNLMYRSNYGHECFHVYVNARKHALDELLLSLELENLSIEDVSKMSWKKLNSKIGKWLKAMRPFVEFYLVGEKSLADQIFGDIESVSNTYFYECSRAAVQALLNFTDAMAVSPRRPEKLIRLLDMYEAVSELRQKVTTLHSEDGLCITRECEDALWRLGDCARATVVEFQGRIASHTSAIEADGGVHVLTKYVMNYLRTLTGWRRTLDELMMGSGNESSVTVSPAISPQKEPEVNASQASDASPTVRHLRSMAEILERNLIEKALLCKNESLQHIFLMNNIQYMTDKARDYHLQTILEDDWIRKHNRLVQYHTMCYQRLTWSPIVAFLRDEGISSATCRNIIKERLRGFYLAFEEVYRTQTGWIIPNEELRENLKLSVSSNVTHAYHSFQRHCNQIPEKHVKYTSEDLENYLSDLFGGSQGSLHGGLKKW